MQNNNALLSGIAKNVNYLILRLVEYYNKRSRQNNKKAENIVETVLNFYLLYSRRNYQQQQIYL